MGANIGGGGAGEVVHDEGLIIIGQFPNHRLKIHELCTGYVRCGSRSIVFLATCNSGCFSSRLFIEGSVRSKEGS